MHHNQTLEALQRRASADPLLTQEDVCQLIQKSISSLYRMRRDGTGPAWLRINGTIRYRSSAVVQYLQAQESHATNGTGE